MEDWKEQNLISHPTSEGRAWRVDNVRQWLAEDTFVGVPVAETQRWDLDRVREHPYLMTAAGFELLDPPELAISDPEAKERFDIGASEQLKEYVEPLSRSSHRGCRARHLAGAA
ncbi:hypothetical protein LTR85_011060 [Meristemomyces frigidus]|nr:hypothetical protein LTR85_011060 [Meristemomyces frigidus]